MASDSTRAENDVLIEVRGLKKSFKTGIFKRKQVDAVKGVSFQVNRGEIVGFLGPNGSGKTTTLKMLIGLIEPSGGEAFMFGRPAPSIYARRKIGFLPENPYVYPHLTPREFVHMNGRLSGMGGAALRERTEQVLDKTGVLYAADRQVRRLSKGMLQRSALAAAMVAEPEMLVLDEPMSGLDPVGRKEVRDILFEERDAGRTIFFSTHILSDVEAMCDHVTILRKGEVVESGSIRQLLKTDEVRTDIVVATTSEEALAGLDSERCSLRQRGDVIVVEVEGSEATRAALRHILDSGLDVLEVASKRTTLEELFMRKAL